MRASLGRRVPTSCTPSKVQRNGGGGFGPSVPSPSCPLGLLVNSSWSDTGAPRWGNARGRTDGNWPASDGHRWRAVVPARGSLQAVDDLVHGPPQERPSTA